LGGAQKILERNAPVHPHKITDLPEIKAVIRGPCPGTGLLGINT